MPTMQQTSKAYDPYVVSIAENATLQNGQKVHEGMLVEAYIIGGRRSYCAAIMTFDMSVYRCFEVQGDKLVSEVSAVFRQYTEQVSAVQ